MFLKPITENVRDVTAQSLGGRLSSFFNLSITPYISFRGYGETRFVNSNIYNLVTL